MGWMLKGQTMTGNRVYSKNRVVRIWWVQTSEIWLPMRLAG